MNLSRRVLCMIEGSYLAPASIEMAIDALVSRLKILSKDKHVKWIKDWVDTKGYSPMDIQKLGREYTSRNLKDLPEWPFPVVKVV